jgi:hypothetical protein
MALALYLISVEIKNEVPTVDFSVAHNLLSISVEREVVIICFDARNSLNSLPNLHHRLLGICQDISPLKSQ